MGIRAIRTAVAARSGQEVAAFATNVCEYLGTIGIPVTWGMEIGGTLGKVYWFQDLPDLATYDANNIKLFTDAGYNEMLAGAEGLFIPGSVEDRLVRTM
jgi:hypothetical protein